MSQFTSYKEFKDKLIDPISDEFDDPTGQWANLVCYDAEQNAKLGTQKHTDIRSFYTSQSLPSYILYMNSKSMSSFAGTYVNNLTTPIVVFKDENWVNSTLATPVVNISTSTTGGSIGANITYYYKLVATNSNGQSFASQTAKITTSSTSSTNAITLNWSAISGATGYKIYRNTLDEFTSATLLCSTISSGSTTTISYTGGESVFTGYPSNIVSAQPNYNNWYGLSLTCPNSTTTTTSSKFSDNTAVNLNSYDSATDYITLSLPDFPLASGNATDLGNSSIVFGNTANDYSTAANIDNIPFNTSGLTWYKTSSTQVSAVTSWAAGDDLELRIPLSKLVNTKNQIIGVKFNIANSTGSSITFRCLAIRCASANWVYAPLDINTLWNVVAPTPSRDGGTLAGTPTSTAIYSTGTVGTNGVSSLIVTGTLGAGNSFPSTVVKSTLVITSSWSGTITTTSGSTNAILASTASGTLTTGMTISSTNIPSGTTVTVTGPSSVVLSNSATADGTGTSATASYDKEYQIAGYSSTNNTLTLSTPAIIPNGTTYSIVKKTIAAYPEWPLNVNNNHLPGTSSNPWPFVYKSFNSNPVIDDSPEPIDGKLQIWFNTGSIINANSSSNYSSIDAYFRVDQRRADQIVLNNQTQAALEGIGDFTKINDSLFENHQSDYNGDLQSQLNGIIQKYLNSYVSTDQLSYFNFQIQWYLSGSTRKANIIVRDDSGIDLYTFTIPDNLIKSTTDYIFMPSINGDSFRIQIFEIYNTSVGDPNHFVLVYDTDLIKDTFVYRTKGKIGWSASLKDGNAHIKSIRSRGMVYSEIKSSPIESYTPVKGVQIITESNARKEIASNITTSPFNVATSLVSPDKKKNGSDCCYRVDNAFGTWQGVATGSFVIEDFKDIRVSFKLFTTVDSQIVSAMLYSVDKNVIIPLTLPDYNPNQWDSVDLIIEGENHLNGSYKLIIGEPSAQSGSTWWIDQISIIRDQMSWYARSYANGINEVGADNWIQTNQAMDSQYAGAVFTNAGTELQVKGLAKTPYVEISKINVIPKYATLGNFRSNV